MPPTICVAIVTARDNEHTSYDRWRGLRRAFLARAAEWADPASSVALPLWAGDRCLQSVLTSEFGSLLTACLNDPCAHSHVEYQLRALELQTQAPDDVLVVSRYAWPDFFSDGPPGVRWVAPMLSDKEAAEYPLSRVATTLEVNRTHPTSFGCADKNTALVLNRCDFLVMLDDCCLPGPGLVEAVYKACAAGDVMLLGHQKVSFDGASLRIATSNWDPAALDLERNVFGIFAAPMDVILGVNGWNTTLDGSVGDLDVELKFRMDAYLRMRGRSYVGSRAARVYEIDHDTPWVKDAPVPAWRPAEGAAAPVRAPGPDLKELRAQAVAEMDRLDFQARQQENDLADREEDEEDE